MSTIESVVGDEQEIRILDTVKRFWGFDDLRPLQRDVISGSMIRRAIHPIQLLAEALRTLL